MKNSVLCGVAIAALLSVAASPAMARNRQDGPEGSLYLQCDGRPNNRTTGIDIVSLFGFENTMRMMGYEDEEPSTLARLYGEDGAAVCTQLIEGERAEGNALRRIELILARALHQIEAGDLFAAEEDLLLARFEAEARGYADDPYFEYSMGISFARVEAVIAMYHGNLEGAQRRMLDAVADKRYSVLAQMGAGDLSVLEPGLAPDLVARMDSFARLMPGQMLIHADRLQEAGRYEEAAQKLEQLLAHAQAFYPLGGDATTLAHAALAHALAGNTERSAELEALTREAMERELANTEFPPDHKTLGQLLALLEIWQAAEAGEMEHARDLMLARDDWVFWNNAPFFVLIDRLREGAPPEQLEGALRLPAAAWRGQARAIVLQRALASDSLFQAIIPYVDPYEWEDRSRNTWRLDRSRIMQPMEGRDGQFSLLVFDHAASAADSVVLHAALQAKHRGYDAFRIILRTPREPGKYGLTAGVVRFANFGDEGVDNAMLITADEVIAELGQLIPPPDEIRQRRRERRNR